MFSIYLFTWFTENCSPEVAYGAKMIVAQSKDSNSRDKPNQLRKCCKHQCL